MAMTNMRRFFAVSATRPTAAPVVALLVVVVLSLGLGLGSAAEAQTVDRATYLPAAAQALGEGDLPTALALTNAVIARNPRDIDALLLKSQILLAGGQARAARDAAQAAFTASNIKPARYAAALRMADIIARQRNYPLSQFWLRRAAQFAETDAQMAQVATAYRAVQKKNPWRFSLSGGVSPNSNINNGSSEDGIILDFFGVPVFATFSPSARALSGYTAQASGSLQYRVFDVPTAQAYLGLQASGRMNWLDATSAAAAPTVSGHDFDFYSLAVIATYAELLPGGYRFEVSGKAGRNWYGGTKLSDFFGGGAAFTIPLRGGQDALTVTARADRSLLVQGGLQPETVLQAGIVYGHKLAWGDILRAQVNYARSFSSAAGQVYSLPTVGLDYKFAQPLLGAHLSLGGTFGYKDYNFSAFSTTGRQDRILSGRASAEFRGISYLGFSPVVSVEAKRVWSNVPRFTQQSFSGGLSIQSRF